MPQSRRVNYFRGRRMRITNLDANGRPVYGDGNAVVTKGYVSVAYTTNTEEGEAITQPNANGENCINETATPTFNGHGIEIVLCEVAFEAFEMMTGQTIIYDSAGVAIGYEERTDVDLSTVNFALEVWSGAKSTRAASTGSQGFWGYFLSPLCGGGVVGDVTIENGAINFTLTGVNTRDGSNWGSGPYPVELVAGVAAALRVPVSTRSARRIMTVEVAPPTVYEGAIPVLDPDDPAITDLTTTIAARQVTFAPVPSGTDPIMYDFGDGTWDYAATGGYIKTYAAAGTYTVTAFRGDSKWSEAVTVV